MKYRLMRLLFLFLALLVLTSSTVIAASARSVIRLVHPSEYFGEPSKSEKVGDVTIFVYPSSEVYPSAKVNEYVDDMKDKGLRLTNNGRMADGDVYQFLEWDDENCINLWWRREAKCIEVRVVSWVKLLKLADPSALEAYKNQEPVIPYPGDYFMYVEKTMTGESSTEYYCRGNWRYPLPRMQVYVDAINKSGLTGGEVIPQPNGDYLAELDYRGEPAVSIRWYRKDNYILVDVSDSICVSDPKASKFTEPTEASEPTAEDTVPNEIYSCSVCGGDGRCLSCGGKGNQMRWTSGPKREYVLQTCSTCAGTKKCNSCAGTGWK